MRRERMRSDLISNTSFKRNDFQRNAVQLKESVPTRDIGICFAFAIDTLVIRMYNVEMLMARIGVITMERGVRPWLANDWLFGLTQLGRENRRCVATLHRFTNQVIRDRRLALQCQKNDAGTAAPPPTPPNNNNDAVTGNKNADSSDKIGDPPSESFDFLFFLEPTIFQKKGPSVTFSFLNVEKKTHLFHLGQPTTQQALFFFE